jgi:acyl dehydratase
VGDVHSDRDVGWVVTERRATLHVTEELVRAYSRRGNFHSDAETATALGLPGLVAQGVQVAGPAYNILLDVWGEDFLAHGELDVRFVGMVVAGDAIEAAVEIDDSGSATVEVVNTTAGTTSVVGTATRG